MAVVNQFVPVSISVGRELAAVAERLRDCTVEVLGADSGRGSGVIWQPDGLIVTNAHVANSAGQTVRLADGREFKAELVRRDPQYDLAALQIEATRLPSAQTRNASSLRVGEMVLAVGNPMDATGAFTVGLVSAVPKVDDVLMRADIRLAPGNSGGPLADVQGRVVGINSMIVGGFGVAVTAAAVEHLLAADHPRSIGVTVQPVGVHVKSLSVLGLLVVELEAGGPAHLSGVLVGDVIVRVNGAWLRSRGEFSDAIRAAANALSIDVLRAERLQPCELKLSQESVAEAA